MQEFTGHDTSQKGSPAPTKEPGKLHTSRTTREIKRLSRLTAAATGLAFALGACSGLQVEEQRAGKLGPAEQQQLSSSLSVASASAEAGQFSAAERLYTELARQFPSAPGPRLGLAYLALQVGAFTRAGKLFVEAEERSATPTARAEALLGAGRASLGEGDVAGAKTHFLAASRHAKGTPSEAWVHNGLGVVATLEGDHELGRLRYDEAVKLSAHPMITANLVRALAQSGEVDEARQLYAKYPASHWLESDAEDLSRLLGNTAANKAVAAATVSGPQVQLFAGRSRDAALAAWGRLSAAENELLGSLTPRVVKAEVPKKGVYYRLRVGPLPTKAAATRLCGLLKGRGRDCFVPAGKWTRDDRPKMAEKSPDARRGGDGAAGSRPGLVTKKPSREAKAKGAAASGAQVQLFSSRSRAGALAAWPGSQLWNRNCSAH